VEIDGRASLALVFISEALEVVNSLECVRGYFGERLS